MWKEGTPINIKLAFAECNALKTKIQKRYTVFLYGSINVDDAKSAGENAYVEVTIRSSNLKTIERDIFNEMQAIMKAYNVIIKGEVEIFTPSELFGGK